MLYTMGDMILIGLISVCILVALGLGVAAWMLL